MKDDLMKESINVIAQVAKSDECKAFLKLTTGIVATTLSNHAVRLATTHPVGAVVVSAVALAAVVYSSIKTRESKTPFEVAA